MAKKTETELTTYEADLQLHYELAARAWVRTPPRTTAKEDAEDEAAYQKDLHQAAKRAHRVKVRELEAAAPVLVYCTACGKPRTGTRRELAHFRKCCDASTRDRKFCRGCGKTLAREAYFATAYASVKGWATFAKCAPCGTVHRPPNKS